MLGRILDSFSKTKQSQRISIRGKCDFPLIFEKSRKIDEKILRRRHNIIVSGDVIIGMKSDLLQKSQVQPVLPAPKKGPT